MKIYIKNMVCNRCISVVRTELNKLGFHPLNVAMGEVEFYEQLSKEQLALINERLKLQEFELLDDKRSKLIEQIKRIIIQQIHYEKEKIKVNFSVLLSQKLKKDYSTISHLFSELEGMTIEQYVILQRIERVKELLVYNELSLSQIADLMNYSSLSHLSGQFKKVTGLSPSSFKELKENKRKPLDDVQNPK
jgi:AraC family transcriptional regulator